MNITKLTDIVSRSLHEETSKRERLGLRKMTAKERSTLIGVCCAREAKRNGYTTTRDLVFTLKRAVGHRLNSRKQKGREDALKMLKEERLRDSLIAMEQQGHGNDVPFFDDYQPLSMPSTDNK